MKLGLATFGLLIATSVVRANDLAYSPPPMPEVPGAGHLIVRLFLLTGIVLVLCLGLLWAARRSNRLQRPGAKSGQLEYVAHLALNRRCSLHLLSTGEQSIVIGTDAAGLQSVLVLSDSFDTTLRKSLPHSA